MAEHHTPIERVHLYRKGWTRGAGMKAIPPELRDDPDFQLGYSAGRAAFGVAMEAARLKFGAPRPTWLRIQDEDTTDSPRGD